MEKNIEAYRRKALYYETDQMGIIHHSNYIRWFEEARIDLMDQIGYGYKNMEAKGIMSPVLKVSCEYKGMVRFGDEVYILPKVEEFENGIKLVISYRVIDANTKELRTTGKSEHCFINKNGRPISLKREFKEAYEAMESMVGIELSV